MSLFRQVLALPEGWEAAIDESSAAAEKAAAEKAAKAAEQAAKATKKNETKEQEADIASAAPPTRSQIFSIENHLVFVIVLIYIDIASIFCDYRPACITQDRACQAVRKGTRGDLSAGHDDQNIPA